MALWYVLHHDETMSRRPPCRIFPYPWKKRRPPTHLRGHMDELHPLEPNQTGAAGSADYAGYGPFDDLRLQGCIKFTHGDLPPRHIWCLNACITCIVGWKSATWLLRAINHPRLLRERLICQNTLLNSLDLSPGSLRKNE